MLVSDYVSVLLVDSKVSLGGYVRAARNAARVSAKEVARRSGGQISEAYVWRIENGLSKNPTPKMLRALARGLQVSEEEVFIIARGKSLQEPSAVESQLLTFFRQLPLERQEDVMRFVRGLHQAHAIKEVVHEKKKPLKMRRVS
jgi:transcriptional regulator with XRE-family HTH domain